MQTYNSRFPRKFLDHKIDVIYKIKLKITAVLLDKF